jgi:hypothetical protein
MICVHAVNNIVTYSYDWDLEQKGEYKHLTVRDPVATIKPSKAHIHLSNLFDGDKFLGKCQRDSANGGRTDIQNEELQNSYCSPNIMMIK